MHQLRSGPTWHQARCHCGRTWQRDILIEQFGPVSDSAWCERLPGDAYAVRQSREQRSTQRIEDGQICRDERIDKGDGTFVMYWECTPRYREQAIYDNRCRFQVNRWRSTRTVKVGPGSAATPMWPSLSTMNGLTAGMGAEREGARSERYVLSLQSGSKTWTCDVPEAVWNKYQEGTNLPVQVRMTGSMDCAVGLLRIALGYEAQFSMLPRHQLKHRKDRPRHVARVSGAL